MRHIKDALIATTIGKIRAYEALQKVAVEEGDDEEAQRLQKMMDEWRKILEELLLD